MGLARRCASPSRRRSQNLAQVFAEKSRMKVIFEGGPDGKAIHFACFFHDTKKLISKKRPVKIPRQTPGGRPVSLRCLGFGSSTGARRNAGEREEGKETGKASGHHKTRG